MRKKKLPGRRAERCFNCSIRDLRERERERVKDLYFGQYYWSFFLSPKESVFLQIKKENTFLP